ncbi:MAG: VWA domain-containing protein [Chloroflexota bacterium]
MEDRIVQFIAGLRAAGVRVSLAESQDAAQATLHIGITDRAMFKSALSATLIKEKKDVPIFEKLFPLYFSMGVPPLIPVGGQLTPEQQALLRAAMRALIGELSDLVQRLMAGKQLSREEMERLAKMIRSDRSNRPEDIPRLTRQMLQKMGMGDLMEQIETLLQQLAEMGMTREALDQIRQELEANAQNLERQVNQFLGQSLADRLTEQPPQKGEPDLMDRHFGSLSESEIKELRHEVARLAARLRSRIALRQKKGDGKIFDAKTTMRENIRHGGVPFEMHWKKKRLKPKFALICDMSESMRDVIEFMLRLMYELHDQVSRARSFGFYDHLEDVTDEFSSNRPDEAIIYVKRRFPYRPYGTDLGFCLADFFHTYMDAIDHRTTVIFLGDGRNNYNDPRLDLVQDLTRRARKVVWFNPESHYEWGSGDSDMLKYEPLVSRVHQVSNLRQLAEAVDKLFS